MEKKVKSKIMQIAESISNWLENISSPSFSTGDRVFFAKRLSFLVGSGLPILESLRMLSEQTRSRGQKKVFENVMRNVANGEELSKSLNRFPNIFGKFAINIIRVGETAGTLNQNLDYLAEELKKRQLLRRKMASTLVYPIFITGATLAITAFLVLYLFPKIMPVFLSMKIALPFSTRVVMGLSNFLLHHGISLIVGIIVIVTALIVTLKSSEKLNFLFDQFLLRMPVIGNIIKEYNIANAGRTLGLLLKSGVQLNVALSITATTTENLVYKKEWYTMEQDTNRGENISEHLKHSPKLFSEIFGQMISVGEKSGNLSDSLIYLSEFYENEVDEFSKELSSLVEPILMVFMGVIIGFIAISIITPIYDITQHLH
ncbi:MAG: type II secretion system F family protein [Patescibacteria group bacterium]